MKARVENYHLHRPDGSHIKIATKVIYEDGFKVEFVDKLSKREALKQAEWIRVAHERRV